ncbi:MAG: winged helix-turn-helix transcriptional regulator [bacterium]|nr:winged helix-turn-helix transcriptional regulator [bacterium]
MSTVATHLAVGPDRVFRAFADLTRLRILHLLQDGERCVSDIMAILQVPQARASHHLNYLLAAGLVEVRKQGLWCHYRLSPELSPLQERLLASLESCSSSLPEFAGDRLRAAEVKASGGCCPK